MSIGNAENLLSRLLPRNGRHGRRATPFPIISLFSGAGGLDLGFAKAGFSPVLATDIDAAACMTLKANSPCLQVLKKDLSQASDGYFLDRLGELAQPVRPIGVIGGPPCQAFSLSNVHKRSDDPRARLPESYASILKGLNREFQVEFFVFENVLGIKHADHKEQFSYFKELFASAGFSIFEGELDAQDFGVPQVRKRVFVVGFNRRKYARVNFEFPQGNGQRRSVRDVIWGLPEPTYFERGMDAEGITFHPNHWCMKPKSKKFFNGFLKEGDVKGRPFRVLEWRKPSWTVAYGHREVHVHPSGKRRLSVYEAMLLQGFPPEYRLCGNLSDQIRLVSDAVPPPMAEALAKSIRVVLEHGKQNRFRQATQLALQAEARA